VGDHGPFGLPGYAYEGSTKARINETELVCKMATKLNQISIFLNRKLFHATLFPFSPEILHRFSPEKTSGMRMRNVA